jgi:hypothetical protein
MLSSLSPQPAHPTLQNIMNFCKTDHSGLLMDDDADNFDLLL